MTSRALVLTSAFNRPDFLVWQHRLLERFLDDEYELVVVSDADPGEMRSRLAETCDRLSLRLEQVPDEIHDLPYLPRSAGDDYRNPNVRHCNSVQWAWDSFGSRHEGPVMIVDSDLFPIRPFSIARTLATAQLAGVHWGTEDRVTREPKSYLWLALVLLDNPRLPEPHTICFNCGPLPGTAAVCDSGGWTNLYLEKHRDLLEVVSFEYLQGHEFFCPYRYAPEALQRLDRPSPEEIVATLAGRGFTPAEVELVLQRPETIELLAGNSFLHYRAGTNYEGYSEEFLARKDRVLTDFFERIAS